MDARLIEILLEGEVSSRARVVDLDHAGSGGAQEGEDLRGEEVEKLGPRPQSKAPPLGRVASISSGEGVKVSVIEGRRLFSDDRIDEAGQVEALQHRLVVGAKVVIGRGEELGPLGGVGDGAGVEVYRASGLLTACWWKSPLT